MKITLESAQLDETEVIIRGDVTCAEVVSLLQHLRVSSSDKLMLYKEDEQFILSVREIVYIETCGSRVIAHTVSEDYEARFKLYELKEQLFPFSFAQISKSTLVNIDFVKSIQAEFSGNYCLRLKNRRETLTISRKYFKEFRNCI